ncbi:hypothetical protein HPHPP8B_0983 [Helicobacter pylori Hp P-8b]|uniref:Uncharacterized protein n=1 Tax=Helicobacter pylori NQ4053 TaxID=992027 RepID=I9ZC95_HELPX|nr:hypothetical protein HPNQ4053_0867 [Helicobacter pylori NQ4053]EJC02750.1 hypothetical protein HPHPP8_1090 [Helicobacter pylori Hp P-8]EJC28421.1 hypothetical protein HPHPP8B_0983 [Helicobacter pylori Hp P-8b]EJC49162.1 hypothetical protein HPHPP30_1559 [Helicobacter pylori Hp P-30]EKE88658.1 hypothetical protein OUK_1176 [Helicobacter pylori R037c]EMH17129.1 hypothetical protein HMPREF1417_01743 [Helicobacter pylori GAM260Bi]
MQLPIGFCGVQVVANSEQSRGLEQFLKLKRACNDNTPRTPP